MTNFCSTGILKELCACPYAAPGGFGQAIFLNTSGLKKMTVLASAFAFLTPVVYFVMAMPAGSPTISTS